MRMSWIVRQLTYRVKSVISIIIMHICFARTIISLPVSSHFATSRSNLSFSLLKYSTCWRIFCLSSSGILPIASYNGRLKTELQKQYLLTLAVVIPLISGYSSTPCSPVWALAKTKKAIRYTIHMHYERSYIYYASLKCSFHLIPHLLGPNLHQPIKWYQNSHYQHEHMNSTYHRGYMSINLLYSSGRLF